MPLASRATQARAARQGAAATEDKTDGADESVKPRKPSANATKPAPSKPAPEKPPFDGASVDDPPAPEKPPRKPRADKGTKRSTPPKVAVSAEMSPADIRARMRQLEVEFKDTKKRHVAEERELKNRHSTERLQLQNEHAALAKALSQTVFK